MSVVCPSDGVDSSRVTIVLLCGQRTVAGEAVLVVGFELFGYGCPPDKPAVALAHGGRAAGRRNLRLKVTLVDRQASVDIPPSVDPAIGSHVYLDGAVRSQLLGEGRRPSAGDGAVLVL